MAKSIQSEMEHKNKTTIPFPNPDEKKKKENRKKFYVAVGVGIRLSKAVSQLSFNIFILGALRKFKINNKAFTSFQIENIKLPLTMPNPQADLLPQMPHPGAKL